MSDYARFKEINKLLATGHPDEAKVQLRGLQASVIALHDEVDRLHARIGNFEEMLSLPKTLIHEDGLVWVETSDGRYGPFCPHCHEAEGSLIRLEKGDNSWWCPCCAVELPQLPPAAGNHGARIIPFPRQHLNF